MIIKSLVILVFIVIVISLGNALYHLLKHRSDESSQKTVKALTLRISLSLALFILVVIAFASGLIQPSGIGSHIQLQRQHALEQQKPQP